AGPLNIEGGVGDAADGPAAVLDAGNRAAEAEAKRIGLHFLEQLALAESERRAEEKLALLIELGERVIAGDSVAIGPVVVAGRESGRRLERIEISERLRVDGILTLARTTLEVAIVGGEGEFLGVHVGNEVWHTRGSLDGRVRQGAPEAEGGAVAAGGVMR